MQGPLRLPFIGNDGHLIVCPHADLAALLLCYVPSAAMSVLLAVYQQWWFLAVFIPVQV